MNEKILISIVSYKESELKNTVQSFYDNAEHKDRLLFSIVSQDYEHPELDFIKNNNLRYIKVSPELSYGVCWARAIASSSFSNYDYYLQIDAHTMSEKKWDVLMINKFKEAEKIYNKPVLSCYPAMYTINDSNDRSLGPVLKNLIPIIQGTKYREWPKHKSAENHTESYYLQGAFIFCKNSFIQEVPYDPQVDFFAEEIILSIRAFGKGYSIVFFNDPLFYHFYAQDRIKSGHEKKPLNDNNPLVDIIYDKTRADSIIKGEVFDIYGLNKTTVEKFCKVTGYEVNHEKIY